MSVSLVENKWLGQLASLAEKSLQTPNNWYRKASAFQFPPQTSVKVQNISKWKSLRRSSVPAPGVWLELQLKNAPSQLSLRSSFLEEMAIEESECSSTPSTVSDSSHESDQEVIPFAHVSYRYLNDFEELACLGRGGFGVVLRARNRIDQKEYAIKRVELSHGHEEEELYLALDEARVMAALEPHPNIVRYFSAWLESSSEDSVRLSHNDLEESVSEVSGASSNTSSLSVCRGDALYIQMGLCGEGRTLAQFIKGADGGGVLGEVERGILDQVLCGVQHMHANGFEHLDITPRNVFQGPNGTWQIGDFSFSKRLGTAGGSELGTHLYAAPEVSVPDKQYVPPLLSGAADVYSLGILMAEMCLTLNTAMERVATLEGIRRHATVPEEIHKKSPLLAQLLDRMTSHVPSARPSISQVICDLDKCQSRPTGSVLEELTQARGGISALLTNHFSLESSDHREGMLEELSQWSELIEKCRVKVLEGTTSSLE